MKTSKSRCVSKKAAAQRRGKDVIIIRRSQLIGAAIIASSGMIALAASVPNAFTAGTPAVAADVNANFQALVTALTTAESKIAALETKLASVSTLTVNGQPTVRFSGVNVQVVNGMNSTATANGTGNLIVGYDEVYAGAGARCTMGTNPGTGAIVVDSPTCTAAGGTWGATGFKTGSHYIVTGSQNNYSRWGGLLAGFQNTSNYDYASVTGGMLNTASGSQASVIGGSNNNASGGYASVTGGTSNTASGLGASVAGGSANTSSGTSTAVGGGASNTASGNFASIGGGASNIASGNSASVSGGLGCNPTAITNFKWAVGVSGTATGCSATLGN